MKLSCRRPPGRTGLLITRVAGLLVGLLLALPPARAQLSAADTVSISPEDDERQKLVGGIPISQEAPVVLSPAATVSLVTVAPGEELYSCFGHTAVWVQDPALGLSRVYNYGTFPFDADFYLKFLRGQLRYMLSVQDINSLVYGAQLENRTVTDQILNLTTAQQQRLFAFLETNYLPENRFYQYDFFYDNCTTRPRDALRTLLGDSLRYQGRPPARSFRQWIDQYLTQKYWQDCGMDLAIGQLSDKVADANESMFLPETLLHMLDSATVLRQGQPAPLVRQSRVLFQATSAPMATQLFTPTVVFALVLLATLAFTAWQFRRRQTSFAPDVALFGLAGLLGIALAFLWFGTDHTVTPQNWHLAWAWPTHALAAGWLLREKKPAWLGTYFLLFALTVAALTLVGWWMLPQELDPEVLPLVAALGVRGWFVHYRIKASQYALKKIKYRY